MKDWTEQAIDEWAVDQMAERMKVKLQKKRGDGRYGWHVTGGPSPGSGFCYDEDFIEMIEDHVKRGNWVDVANLAMFMELRDTPPEAPHE